MLNLVQKELGSVGGSLVALVHALLSNLILFLLVTRAVKSPFEEGFFPWLLATSLSLQNVLYVLLLTLPPQMSRSKVELILSLYIEKGSLAYVLRG